MVSLCAVLLILMESRHPFKLLFPFLGKFFFPASSAISRGFFLLTYIFTHFLQTYVRVPEATTSTSISKIPFIRPLKKAELENRCFYFPFPGWVGIGCIFGGGGGLEKKTPPEKVGEGRKIHVCQSRVR